MPDRDPVTLERIGSQIAALRRRSLQDPSDSGLRYELGRSYALAGRFTEAVAELEQAVSLDPSHAKALAMLGFSLSQVGRSADAEQALQKALAIDDKDVFALAYLGSLYYRGPLIVEKKFERATQLYAKAVSLEPKNLVIRIDYAEVLSEECRKNGHGCEDAVEEWRRVAMLSGEMEDVGTRKWADEKIEELRRR